MIKLAAKDICTGCTACASVCPKGCITMEPDPDGFRYPVVDSTVCVGCRLCEKACPVLVQAKPEHTPQAWAAYSRDTDMRLESSSGGVFTELARLILADGGAVCGAVYDDRFRVVHTFGEKEEDLARMRGAKYAKSDLSGIFPSIKSRLERGQQVLFTGTPCQVAGLLGFLGKTYENLTTVDFVCHGVPSPVAWKSYFHYLEKDGTVRHIDLRAKDTGWSRYQYCHRIEFEREDPQRIPNSESLFMKLFIGDYINRLSCGQCRFRGYARVSDLTIGDFWGIWDIAPEMDDDRGTSVVLIQSDKGQELWEKVCPRLTAMGVSLSDASGQNPAMIVAGHSAADRDEALDRIRSGDLMGCEELFRREKNSLAHRIRNKTARILRKILGR